MAALLPILEGCYPGSLSGPERIFTVDEEIGFAKSYVAQLSPTGTGAVNEAYRNSVITARMYAIDLEYTQYEGALLHEGQGVDFGTKVAEGALTTAASVVPAVATSHALSEAATLVNGLDSAYNDKVLKSQMIQNILASMRTARHDQAAIIYANMYCPLSVYPVGMALSDLETYYRAGTFQTGLIKLMQTTGKAETDSKANQDNNKPAQTPDAKATLDGNAKEAQVKATTSTTAQKAAAGIGTCRTVTTTDIGSLPQRGGDLAKKDKPTSVAGQPAANARM